MTIFDKRKLAIAKKTIKMPDAMVFALCGMTKEEAKHILQQYRNKENKRCC